MMLLREAEVVYSGRRIEGSAKIRAADDVARMFRDLEACTVERFCVLHVNIKNVVVSRQTVAQGTVGHVEVHPREVFRAAVMSGAHSIILVHNHPSGDCEPSSEDMMITNRIKQAGELIGIKILDHVIIGDGKYFSFNESGIF